MRKDIQCILMSDLHGSWKPVKNLYLRHKEELDGNEQNYLISLGDLGSLYYFNDKDQIFKRKLGSYPFTYFAVRGNHEARPSEVAKLHPDEWRIEKFWGGDVWVEKRYPYIKYAMDGGGVYDIPLSDGQTIHTLVLPGAFSVHEDTRRLWKEEHEQLTHDERKFVNAMITKDFSYDLVLSHTCPLSFQPSDLFSKDIDESKVDETMEKWLDWVERHIDYKAWCWGHYHQWREYPSFKDGRRRLMLFNTFGALLTDIMNSISTSIVCKY